MRLAQAEQERLQWMMEARRNALEAIQEIKDPRHVPFGPNQMAWLKERGWLMQGDGGSAT